MDAIILLGLLVALALAAPRWGHDSRDGACQGDAGATAGVGR